ncbi:hypothetical protein [Pseudodesulfovibrio indicus]|uniref:hypothetical protein n=1 Tax=Pseudodesulfovibrio indicus TaxID=1716143 RepID=UPI002930D278|nr:hypothetical protein [Pseudodesulfovibrio indicus]
MVLEYEFLGRSKLRKGHTYPIKRGDLDKALEAAGVSELEMVTYSTNYDDPDLAVLRLFLLGESRRGYREKREPVLSVYSIPASLSEEIKGTLEKERILARVSRWLKWLETASNVVRSVNQEILCCYDLENERFLFRDKGNNTVKLP